MARIHEGVNHIRKPFHNKDVSEVEIICQESHSIFNKTKSKNTLN